MNESIIIGLCMCDIAIVSVPDYQYNLELAVMIMICIVLVANVGMYVTQVIIEYYPELGQWLQLAKRKEVVESVV